ncbi:hypothetical protein ACFVGM_08585 [Kitasatospora purpeofusca]|uniref:hypothetical protein n=1 Tax=Kitasatospora purpeofusca TaxID=67352 RepID=UPI00367CCB76
MVFRPSHRMTLALHPHLKEQETHRETAPGGVIHIYKSRLADVRVGEVVGHGPDGTVAIHEAVMPDGEHVFVGLLADPAAPWKKTGSLRGSVNEDSFVPTREFFHGAASRNAYASVQDIKSALRDSTALEVSYTREREMRTTALAAAEAVGDVVGASGGLSEAGYVAACAAIGLEACPEAEVSFFGGPHSGVFDHLNHTVDHIVWAQLVRRRAAGQAYEREERDAAATAVVAELMSPAGPLSREQYEAASAAIGFTAMPDEQLGRLLGGLGQEFEPVIDIGASLASQSRLGTRVPKTAARLAERRYDGMAQELVERRRAERAELAERGVQFATELQVDEIMRLLGERARSGEGGGFFIGPTDFEGVKNMTSANASTYITSLRGEY